MLVAMAVFSHDEVAAVHVSPPALGDPPPAGTRVMSDNPLASPSALPKVHHCTDMAVGDRLNATDPVLLDHALFGHQRGRCVQAAAARGELAPLSIIPRAADASRTSRPVQEYCED